jgi:hypothetical protein
MVRACSREWMEDEGQSTRTRMRGTGCVMMLWEGEGKALGWEGLEVEARTRREKEEHGTMAKQRAKTSERC